MDDTQRLAFTGLGGGFMGAALTWVSGISLSSHPTLLRFAPPAVLFVAGAVLFIWAVRGGNPVRVALDRRAGMLERAIADGQALLQMEAPVRLHEEWMRWFNSVEEMLREDFGLEAANGFHTAGTTHGIRAAIAAQVAYLVGLQ